MAVAIHPYSDECFEAVEAVMMSAHNYPLPHNGDLWHAEYGYILSYFTFELVLELCMLGLQMSTGDL